MPRHEPADHLAWRTTEVAGRRVNYGVAGRGLPVLFVHGWALGSHAYERALKRLVRLGCRVYAPALPGFGGTAGLAGGACDLAAYAAWTDAFLDGVGETEPVLAVGHSFGGAVAAKLARDFPDRVGYLVLINSLGGGIWSRSGGEVRSIAERPLWDWAIHFPIDIFTGKGALPVLSAILPEALPNMIHNPLGVWKAAEVARRADVTTDLIEVKGSGIPILVLWGEGDTIVPRANFEALCAAAGSSGALVPGRHSWLIADPESFAEVMTTSVVAAAAARAAQLGLAPPIRWSAQAASGRAASPHPALGRAATG
jgi:pimeloyl-ACP methyl ester carboxylesterase